MDYDKNFDTYKVFDFKSKEEYVLEQGKNKKMKAISEIEKYFTRYPTISFPIMYFSTVTTGLNNLSISELLKYLYDNFSEEVIVKLNHEFLMAYCFHIQEYQIVTKTLFLSLGYKTEEEMNNDLSQLLLDIAKELFVNPMRSVSLKVFSEATTDISYEVLKDFMGYIKKTFSEKEQEKFLQVLEIV